MTVEKLGIEQLLTRVKELDKSPIFLRPSWFQQFEKHIVPASQSPFYLSMNGEGEQNTFLALMEETTKGRFGYQTHYLHSLTNYYSPYFDLGGIQGVNTYCYQNLVSQSRQMLTLYDQVNLLPLTRQQAMAWRDAFAAIGFSGEVYEHSSNWYHDDIENVEHYWSLRPSRLRNTLKRKRDKMKKEGGYDISIVNPSNISELRSYLADYHNVYFDSWKKTEPTPGFIDSVAEDAWLRGELRLGLVYHEKVPVAAQIWFVAHGKAYIFKLAHRKTYTEHSVGTVLTAFLFEHVIGEDGVTYVDFLTGDDDYKKDWMNHCRPLYGVQLCNTKTTVGLSMSLANTVSRFGKQVLSAVSKKA